MGTENLTPPTIAEMLRITGGNTATFMNQVADHIDKLEQSVVQLQNRVQELEGKLNEPK